MGSACSNLGSALQASRSAAVSHSVPATTCLYTKNPAAAAHLMACANWAIISSASSMGFMSSSVGTSSSYTVSSTDVYAFWHAPNGHPNASRRPTSWCDSYFSVALNALQAERFHVVGRSARGCLHNAMVLRHHTCVITQASAMLLQSAAREQHHGCTVRCAAAMRTHDTGCV